VDTVLDTGGGPLDDLFVFRAGPGGPANRRGADRRDMGEEVTQPLPPAPWHAELEAAVSTLRPGVRGVVVDVSGLEWLPAEDWGLLLRVVQRLAPRCVRCALLGGPFVARTSRVLGLAERLPAFATLADAARWLREERA
jgi:hypothetical protein